MSRKRMYQTIILPYFKRQLKPYAKKHRDLKQAVIDALSCFDARQHHPLGGGVYKMRLKTNSMQKGKSGSFRLIVLVIEADLFLVPMTIYFKGDVGTISKNELNNHLKNILFELRIQATHI